MSKTRTTLTLLAGAAVLGIALTGCSAGGQSTAQACSELQSSVQSASSDLSSSLGSLATDPDKSIDDLEKVSEAFSDGADKVSNADVKKAATTADKSMKNLVAELKDYVASDDKADTEGLQAASKDVQTDFTAIGEVCN